MKLFLDKTKCCGCELCAQICAHGAIVMTEDSEGYMYPQINATKCIECGLCKSICPMRNYLPENPDTDNAEVWALKHIDSVRMASSSGGAFTALSDVILSEGGLCFGVSWNEDMQACHMIASSGIERDAMRGSKYVQSRIHEAYIEAGKVLKAGKSVLFTGTACQIAALRAFIKRRVIRDDLLYCVDVLCHGVSSPGLYTQYIQTIEKKKQKKVLDLTFRSKENGWGGYLVKVVFVDGSTWMRKSLLQTFPRLYSTDCPIRPSCYECTFNALSLADITIGDFWGIERSDRPFSDEKGVSLIVVRTSKGAQLLSRIHPDVALHRSSLENAISHNYNLTYPTARPEKRAQFWSVYEKHGYVRLSKLYGGYGVKNRFRKFVRSVLKRG